MAGVSSKGVLTANFVSISDMFETNTHIYAIFISILKDIEI